MTRSGTQQTALFIGAHPDDIELGAGGTVLKLQSQGWQVFACVLTREDDPTTSAERRAEATAGLGMLGIPSNNVLFADFPDGRLVANRETIAKLRGMLGEAHLDPTLIFTHSEHENHNDHRAAHTLTLGTFRGKAILCYGIVKSVISSAFVPRIFTDISPYYQTKLDAFNAHKTQLTRISLVDLHALDANCGTNCGFDKAEGFELILQQGAQEDVGPVRQVNDCPFHRFWYSMISNNMLILLHAIPVVRSKREGNWPVDKDREGIEILQRAFGKVWAGPSPIENYSCATSNVESLLEKSNVLLSGGSVSNSITRDHFDHFFGLRYHIDYEMPGYRNISIRDRQESKNIRAQYREDAFGSRKVVVDFGILTVMRNPMSKDHTFIGCMGIHGYGSLGCYKVLADRRKLAELAELMPLPLPPGGGYQVLVEYRVNDEEVNIMSASLHSWATLETQS